ncbi:MAG: hypothetical protein RJA70_4163, partial [Pseudomonadota bacterium]
MSDWRKAEFTRVEAKPREGLGPLRLRETFENKSFVVVGGTGFLGKVWWVMMLHRFPEVRKLYIVVRPRRSHGRYLSGQDRFWSEIATNDCLSPLREQHGEHFFDFLREKVTVIEGDVVQPLCGISAQDRDAIRGQIDAVVNAAGVVDFQPPLDAALDVNAFGMQSLVALSTDLGSVPIMHTSTCFVAGYRTGIVEEADPLQHPFPYAGKLERAHWDPDREISECLDIIAQARHRADDAFRQSHFLDQARQNLEASGEPARGQVLENEIARVRRKFVEAQLAELGLERARFWGWPNTYTYTKSIGEQIAARSGLAFTVVRPAIIESCVEFPVTGWNEGVNTSAPLIYAIREGQLQLPGARIRLDIIPCDMVASGMILALAELLRGEHQAVYQYGCSDTNSMTMDRMYELSGLYKRAYYRRTGRGGPIGSYLAGHIEGALLPTKTYDRIGPAAVSKGAKAIAGVLARAPQNFASFLKPAVQGLRDLSKMQDKIGEILDQFKPFMADLDYEFRSDNTRAAFARLDADERALLIWAPEEIDWRKWFLKVHAPGLERWVFPELETRLRKRVKPLARHETLSALLLDVAERHDLAVALQRVEPDGLSRLSYRDLKDRALACATRLKHAGIVRGDRVILAAKNHPDWVIAFYGIIFAGATVVPLDSEVDVVAAKVLFTASRAKVALLDERVGGRLGAVPGELGLVCQIIQLKEVSAELHEPKLREPEFVAEQDVATLIYTSGTTGRPKGVMLSHRNLTSLLASLAPLFPIGKDDRVLSVLPLHHTFELTCGMLLPISRGSRIVYLDELNADKLQSTLKQGRITAMVGVPALWEMLERKIVSRVSERGGAASKLFELMVDLNRNLGRAAGVDIGRLIFGPVHQELGGHLRFLVSGGASLNDSTHALFNGLGLHLTEGYGLTEAAPVLSVAQGGPRGKSGQVGRPVPGVELTILNPNADGVGDVVARGPSVMLGYADDAEATAEAIDAEGWLKTGDLGRLDHKGRLFIVGRAKDTIVTSTGENVYPDDVEARLGYPAFTKELAVVGVSDGRGGERVALACVVEYDGPRAEGHEKARAAIDQAIADLPPAMRPAVVTLLDTALPRTSTRKVKRKELRVLIERQKPAENQAGASSGTTGTTNLVLVQRAVAAITRREPHSVESTMSLRGDLGCDSLMLLEVLVALEGQLGRPLDAESFTACQTVGDVERILGRIRPREVVSVEPTDDSMTLTVPEPLRKAAMAWLGRGQASFYSKFMRTEVSGRAFIPHNRSVLIVANHSSHLDMGLVKYGLGEYAKDMVSLAAKDYFFEGKWRKAFFENFSNLQPISRTGSLRQLLRTAGELLERGEVVLLFPEGTRTTNGSLEEFKPVLGYLALDKQVDILPVWLGGTFEALPKGATVLHSRRLQVRIGPPLTHKSLRAHTAGQSTSEASRNVSRLAREAVYRLSQGSVLDLDREAIAVSGKEPEQPQGLASVFGSLEQRFVRGMTTAPVSYYFSLGAEKWTLQATADSCKIARGKTVEAADCVLKTSPEIFRKIVGDGYTPSAAEFMAGAVKS